MASAVGATMGPEMEAAVAELRETQGALQSLMDGRAALQTQAHENDMVKQEFKLLGILLVTLTLVSTHISLFRTDGVRTSQLYLHSCVQSDSNSHNKHLQVC